MWLFKKNIAAFCVAGIALACSVKTSFAQQMPVFVFPDWDQVQPEFHIDTVPCPLKPEVVSREKIKMLVKLREMPLPKSKNKKPQPDTMAVWKFDSEGRVSSYRSFENPWTESVITYTQGHKINTIRTTVSGSSKWQALISYNRSGLPALIITSESRQTGTKDLSVTADTISLLYNAAGQLVVKNRKSGIKNGADEQKETVSETYSYDGYGNLERRMLHNKNGERQCTDSMVIYRSKGVVEFTHFHLDFVNYPGAAYAIDRVTLDSASRRVNLYAYNLATGNGNLLRNVSPGERRTYNYDRGKPTYAAFMQTGKEPHEETFFRYDEQGQLQTEFFKRKINSGGKKGTQLYDAFRINYTYDKRGILLLEEKKVFNDTRVINTNGFPEASGKEDLKRYERYRFVTR